MMQAHKDNYGEWLGRYSAWLQGRTRSDLPDSERPQYDQAMRLVAIMNQFVDAAVTAKEDHRLAAQELQDAQRAREATEDRYLAAVVAHESSLLRRVPLGEIPQRVTLNQVVQLTAQQLDQLEDAPFKSLPPRQRGFSLDLFVEDLGPGVVDRLLEAGRESTVVLWGGPGTGKTPLACCIARYEMARHLTVSFNRGDDERSPRGRWDHAIYWVNRAVRFPNGDHLRQALSDSTYESRESNLGERILREFGDCGVFDELAPAIQGETVAEFMADALTKVKGILVLDDVLMERPNQIARKAIGHVVRARHNKRYPTIYTTNLSPRDVARDYGEAVADRLREVVLHLKGSSFRSR